MQRTKELIIFHYYYYFSFSEYRAELYSRLETRRMKKLTRENRRAESDKQRSQPLKERKVKKERERKAIEWEKVLSKNFIVTND